MGLTSRTIAALLCIWLSVTTIAFSQRTAGVSVLREIPVELISTGEGLSQGMIGGLVEDNNGFLWIGTKDGLNRYDGASFKVYRADPQDPFSLGDNFIRALYMDSRGLLWVGTNTEGLELFDYKTDRFIHLSTPPGIVKGKETMAVSEIMEDGSGNIVIFSHEGNYTQVYVPVGDSDLFSSSGWEVKEIGDIYPGVTELPGDFDSRNIIGFTRNGLLWYYVSRQLYAVSSAGMTRGIAADSQEPLKVWSDDATEVEFFFDPACHSIYLVEEGSRILKYDSSAKRFDPVIQIPEEYAIPGKLQLVDQQERIWGIAQGSVFRLDLRKGEFIRMRCIGEKAETIPTIKSKLTCHDRHGNIWGSTNGHGVVKISARNDQFIREPFPGTFGERMTTRTQNALCVNDREYRAFHKTLLQSEAGLAIAPVPNCALKDDEGEYWLPAVDEARREGYVIRLDPLNKTYEIKASALYAHSEWFAGPVFSDRHGEIWFGERFDGGRHSRLFHLDQQHGRLDTFTFPVDVISNAHRFICDWYVTSENIFWLGTKQGLFSFHSPTGEWQHFQFDKDDSRSLSQNSVLSLCPDPVNPQRYLWVGTDGGGLNRLDFNTGTFDRFSTSDGLPNDVIYAVQSDAHDNLWMSTNFGLCQFNPVTHEVRSFTSQDGLPGNEFNRYLYCKSDDGVLCFGGVSGAVCFDPETFYQRQTPSPILINQLRLLNEEVVFQRAESGAASKSFRLSAPIEQCRELVFRYEDRMMITLGFALLDLTNPSTNEYRYRLGGFNSEWINAGSLGEATYTNLRPGDYMFQVAGRNSAGIWSAPASLQIVILPPWWGTWWFRILVLLIIASGIYALYRFRLRQAMKLQLLRNRIAADLHDEIGSTLSSISLAGSVIDKKLNGASSDVRGLLDQISQNTDNMMEAMSDIVWAVNTKNDRFDNVVNRMRAFAIGILEPKDIAVHFTVESRVSNLQLNMEQRKNLYLIFKEAVNNASKYAECQNVRVDITLINKKVIMRIADDGKGMLHKPAGILSNADNHTREYAFGGNGIANMRKRAEELRGKLKIESAIGGGTVIEVRVVI